MAFFFLFFFTNREKPKMLHSACVQNDTDVQCMQNVRRVQHPIHFIVTTHLNTAKEIRVGGWEPTCTENVA